MGFGLFTYHRDLNIWLSRRARAKGVVMYGVPSSHKWVTRDLQFSKTFITRKETANVTDRTGE